LNQRKQECVCMQLALQACTAGCIPQTYTAHYCHDSLQVGPVTILINNAGIMPCKPMEKQTEKDIRLNFEVNIISHFWVS
jgi:NAD(P)-dependent dehydrogenase (short-subunit alcohol dehydrogenase family)